MKDYYEILGVAQNASPEEIKRAYRKLAHQHHPDKKGGNEQKFKEINEAYQILSNEEKRHQYDQFGTAFSGAQSGFSGANHGFGFDFGADLGDVFETFFSGFSGLGRQGRGRSRGSDIAVGIEIPFSESEFGSRRSLSVEKMSPCSSCKGNGSEPGSAVLTCDICNGTGTVRESKKSIFGTFTSLNECSRCAGKGKIPEKKCYACKGNGIVKAHENVDIEIPPGIRDGEAIKFSGKGQAISNGMPGDLYVRIHILNHPLFRREGNNLIMELQIPSTTMLKGGEIQIETLDGKIQIKVPELSKTGDMLRIRGKGVGKDRGGRGDLLIRLTPKLPRKLSSRARQLLDELEKEGL